MGSPRVRLLVLHAGVIGMELTYVYLGIAALRGSVVDNVSFPLIVALYPLAFSVKRVMTAFPRAAGRLATLATVTGIVVISLITLLAVQRAVSEGRFAEGEVLQVIAQVVLGGAVWWLGSSLVRNTITHQYLCARFQSGLLVMVLLTATAGTSFVPVVVFFLLALIALAVSRWESSLARSPRVLRDFPVAVLAWGGLAVLVPSLAVFFLLSPDAAQFLLGSMAGAFSLLSNLFPETPPQPPSSQPRDFGFSCAFKPEGEGGRLPTPPPAGPATPDNPFVLWMLLLIVYLAVLIAVALGIRHLVTRRRQTGSKTVVTASDVTRTRLPGAAAFLRSLGRRLWSHLRHLFGLGWLRRRMTSTGAAPSVRFVYLGLLRLGAKKGARREPSRTPLEFARQLGSAFPHRDEEIALITRLYIKDRYGRQPLGDEGFRLALRAWRRITATRKP